MNKRQEEIYKEGYLMFECGLTVYSNPYSSSNAKYWSCGWEDAQKDWEDVCKGKKT